MSWEIYEIKLPKNLKAVNSTTKVYATDLFSNKMEQVISKINHRK